MGWLNIEERAAFKRKYGVEITYLCNHCNHPIWDIPWIDPRGGYHKFPKQLPKNVRPLTSREPKVTYHFKPCGQQILGKKMKISRSQKAMNTVLTRLLKRPKPMGYWTKEKLIEKLKGILQKRTIKKAVRELRDTQQLAKRQGGYLIRRQTHDGNSSGKARQAKTKEIQKAETRSSSSAKKTKARRSKKHLQRTNHN